jgi:hypothetical protein
LHNKIENCERGLLETLRAQLARDGDQAHARGRCAFKKSAAAVKELIDVIKV